MARYNSVNTFSSVAGGTTVSSPYSGLLTTLTGSGTVTIPSPVLYAGSTQTFYNSTASAITLSSAPALITGPGLGGGATTLSLPAGSVITLVSDGTNYLTQGWLGGNISATTLSASAGVTLSPSTTGSVDNVTIGTSTAKAGNFTSIGVTTAGTGAFTTLTASGDTQITSSTASTTSGTGSLKVTGGVGIGGSLFVGGTTNTINATNPTSWVSVDTGLTTQSMYMQVNTTSTDTRIGSYTSHKLGIYTNNSLRMTLDTSGNVGIGTATPSALLTTYFTGLYDTATRRYVDIVGDFAGTNAASATNAGAFTGIRFGNSSLAGKYAVIGAVSEDPLGYARTNGLSFWTSVQDTAAVERMRISGAGHLVPAANDTYDLGATGAAWRNIYTNDLHLNNESKAGGNDIDGTTGNWTIQEGLEDLYIINNKTGKKYAFALREIK
jgi:hypothetical protein